MRVTIVGAGRVARALTAGLTRAGHTVTLAVRATPPDAPAPTRPVAGAADDADLTVLAVPFDAVTDTIAVLAPGPDAILVDATNPFGRPLPAGVPSGAALVSAAAPRCRVVKAFNVVGAEHLSQPELAPDRAVLLPVCGDDPQARSTVAELARSIGFDVVEVGGLANAGPLEEAARYWGLLAHAGGLGRQFGLVAVARDEQP